MKKVVAGPEEMKHSRKVPTKRPTMFVYIHVTTEQRKTVLSLPPSSLINPHTRGGRGDGRGWRGEGKKEKELQQFSLVINTQIYKHNQEIMYKDERPR